MPPDKPPAFEWNIGFLGAQFGGSFWMLIASTVFWSTSKPLALIWLGGFLAINGFGLYLWSQRRRLDAYLAIQALLLGTMLVGLTCWSYLLIFHFQQSQLIGYHPWKGFAMLLIGIPALMLVFSYKERRSQRA